MATTTSRAAIVAAARTPIGTARKGTLANVPAIELAKPVVAAVVAYAVNGLLSHDHRYSVFSNRYVIAGGSQSESERWISHWYQKTPYGQHRYFDLRMDRCGKAR